MSARRSAFNPLQGAEKESALAAIRNAGFDVEEFVLEERRSEMRLPGGGVRVYKLISVKRVTVGFQRQYNTGAGSGWPYEFERDLRLLVFGPKRFAPDAKGVSASG
ncbi:MAG: hypothetical protein ACXWGT_08210 [Usitatibacter sp.]